MLGIFWFSLFLFLRFQAQGIAGGDSGDLVTAAATFGVPHPPGYPLYTFLGWLLSKLPLFTPAWRVALLSSIPHAVVVAGVYWLVTRLTKMRLAGLFAAATLAGNYLFFLYSVTPEVFALFDVFVIMLTVVIFQWSQTRDARYLYAASFVFGLSLSHHHVILFFVPAIAYWVWQHKHALKHWFIGLLVYWLIGLFPYLYLPVAGRGTSIINWNRPDTVVNFLRLVTRADYGTFVSGGYYGSLISQRLVQVKAYLQFLFLDATPIGIVLVAAGWVWLWRHNRRLLWFFTIALISLGPVFFFYASFPLVNRFTLGTYERFLLPSYVLLSVLIGLGCAHAVEAMRLVASRLRLNVPLAWLTAGVVVSLGVYPVSTLGMSVWRFWGMSQDRTAQHLGEDILASVDRDGILLLVRDTQLFTTQYVRYGLGVRPDIMALHASRLATADYPGVIARVFPRLSIPKETGPQFLGEFVKENRKNFAIFSNEPLPVDSGWVWVQQGLVYRLVQQSNAPTIVELKTLNDRLWQGYYDPRQGILARYPHLVLAEVLDVYGGARIEWGKALLGAGLTRAAKDQFLAAIFLGGDTQTPHAYMLLGVTELFLKECEKALTAFAKAKETSFATDTDLPLYEAVTYRDCSGDPKRAQQLFEQYEQLQKQRETPIAP